MDARHRTFTVLIIDDDTIMLRVMSKVLANEGYGVTMVTSAQDALVAIGQVRPDLVLCDMAMPVMDGIAFLQHCRSTPTLATLKIVIVSSVSDEFKVRQALQLGAVAHISKPFTQAQLVGIVKESVRLTA